MEEGVAVVATQESKAPTPKSVTPVHFAKVLPEEVREVLGRKVRELWSNFILAEFPNPPAGWIKPWEEMSSPMQEVDRVIGEGILVDFMLRIGVTLPEILDEESGRLREVYCAS